MKIERPVANRPQNIRRYDHRSDEGDQAGASEQGSIDHPKLVDRHDRLDRQRLIVPRQDWRKRGLFGWSGQQDDGVEHLNRVTLRQLSQHVAGRVKNSLGILRLTKI
jgi:hypothetical protein